MRKIVSSARPKNYPDIWGENALFAFSGADGSTDRRNSLVGSLLDDRPGVLFHTAPERLFLLRIKYRGRNVGTFADLKSAGLEVKHRFVLSDAVETEILNRKRILLIFRFFFVDCGTLVGEVICRSPKIECRPVAVLQGKRLTGRRGQVQRQYGPDDFSVLLSSGGKRKGRFVFCRGARGVKNLEQKAGQALKMDLEPELGKRLAFYEKARLPHGLSRLSGKTYRKSAAVLKVNIESAQGANRRRWTTPNRYPHRCMWLWDSAFHAVGLKYLDDELAWDAVLAVLERIRPDGFIPHMLTPDGQLDSQITQPPLLAWAAWDVYRKSQNIHHLRYAYPRLRSNALWFLENRCRNNLFWWLKDESSDYCRSGESGMDNTPRFDHPGRDYAVDLSCFMVRTLKALASMAEILGFRKEIDFYRHSARLTADAVNLKMWDKKTGFYYDRREKGGLVKIKTIASFTPLFGGVADQARAARLVEHLKNPAEFLSEFPIPTVALNERSYSRDMWRGPVWLNYNFLIIRGLKRYGYHELAGQISRITTRRVEQWYWKTGVIYEFYDSRNKIPPAGLPRKAGRGIGRVICDYNWSAAVYLALKNEVS